MQALDIKVRPAPRRTCRVHVGAGALDLLVRDLAAEWGGRRLIVVSDSNVAPLHAESLADRLRGRGPAVELLTFPAGETSKVRETKSVLEDQLYRLGADRDSVLVAVGGGVTGDLAGFLAATWHRGIPFVQVPTSLLAMADAAVGGKTAVNLPGAKNLVGSFHQPWAVYADVNVLSTLPDESYRDGFAEIVKVAAVAGIGLFRRLESTFEALLARAPEALEHAVAESVRIKGRVVAADERESGRRAILNFGHTVGHALEAIGGYDERHGRAVSIGMGVESRIAAVETGFPRAHVARLQALLAAFGLPADLPSGTSIEALLDAARHDKKAREGKLRFALPVRLGRMPGGSAVTTEVGEGALKQALTGPENRPN